MLAATRTTAAAAPISYSRDVLPILSNNCFRCHGPDSSSREADLRFDRPEPDGGFAFVPGRPEVSEAFKRIEAADPEERMPPLDSNKSLTLREVAILKQWVAEGAKYEPHWSFVPPAAREPAAVNHRWARNAIDHFVLPRIHSAGLTPNREADRSTLLRRVTLDLTGLPPTPKELDAFLADKTTTAYERVVERLLSSPHFGERMASVWLDAARYADSNGYFGDATRQIWPWRDWVIAAFNRDMPFDRFTVEQLAGDLLPNATVQQRIATGFLRNSMTNNESGAIDEEFRVEYVAERVETVGTVWLGLTVGCARCHDHKYDPLSQKEYYQLFAYFNHSPEKGLVTEDDPPPVMDVATPDQQRELDRLVTAKAAAESAFQEAVKRLRPAIATWEQRPAEELLPPPQDVALHVSFDPEPKSVTEKGNLLYEATGLVGNAAAFDGMQHLEASISPLFRAEEPWSVGVWLRPTGSLGGVLGKITPTGERRGFEVVWKKGRYQINLVNRWGVRAIELVTRDAAPSRDWQQLIVSYDGSRQAAGFRVYVDAKPVAVTVLRDSLTGSTETSEPLRIGRRDSGLGYYGKLDELRVIARAVDAAGAEAWYWSDRLAEILRRGAVARSPADEKFVHNYYVAYHGDATAQAAQQNLAAAEVAEKNYRGRLPKTLVMQELAEPRRTFVLKRGKYDDRGVEVLPRVPEILPPMPVDAPPNRLGLAQWLVSPEHPLTSRVAVNRLWQLCFGEGLVRTVNDFGAQGEQPTHPELLDWLANRFKASGWSTKEILALIVTSATYRQSSAATPQLLERDPDNRLLARGPRFRMSGEMIRDHALAASGLLVKTIGGPSVKPYQPDGLWESVSYDSELSYQEDTAEGLWRRSLYTFWKRQMPPPLLLTFDAPTRETCTVSRARTNTPLQALALLNDVSFIEAGRSLASSVLSEHNQDVARLKAAFRRVTARSPEAEELSVLGKLLAQRRAAFRQNPKAATDLVALGASKPLRSLDPVELAAWTVTMHTLLNLDETVTRR